MIQAKDERSGRTNFPFPRPERTLQFLTAVLALAALALLVVEYGFPIGPGLKRWLVVADISVAAAFVSRWGVRLWLAPIRRTFLKSSWLETLLVGLLALQLVFLVLPVSARGAMEGFRLADWTKVYLVALQVYVIGHALVHASETIVGLGIRPPIVILVSFALIIFLGTLLLMLPKSAADSSKPIAPLDAFFTSTSATCVTGLTVPDTGRDFSVTGQWIILGLIQVGGLGLITFTAFFLVLARGGLGVRQSLMLGEASSYNLIGELGRFLAYVVGITLTVEIVGAVLIFDAWREPGMSLSERARWSLFHSVSAFCNAGFGLKSNSLMNYTGSLRMNLTILGLFVLGGVGFAVMMNLLRFRVGTLPMFRRWKWVRPRVVADEISRMNTHTRIVLWMSGLLLAVGAGAFWGLESGGVLRGRPPGEQAMISLFQSGSCRTAGFNTVDVGRLRIPTLAIMIALMAVGASPGSTGGGIKTVGVAVLFATLVAMMRNREHVEIHRRTVPRVIVNQAVTVVVLYGLAVFFFSTALSITDPGIAYYQILFETVSALSTVGLSTGITPSLSAAGKVLLCLMMVVGRVGPLVVLMSIAGRGSGLSYEYPKEEVAVA